MAIYHGQIISSSIWTGTQYHADSRTGTTTNNYKGTQEQILGLYTYYKNLGWSVDAQSTPPSWTLTATLQSDSDPIPPTVWEVSSHPSEQTVLECTDVSAIGLLPTHLKLAIEKTIKDPESHAIDHVLDPINGTSTSYPSNVLAAMNQVYHLMALGDEGRQIFVPTVRRTITTGYGYNPNWVLSNVGKVLSKSTLVSSYNIPVFYQNLIAESTPPSTDVNGVETAYAWLEGGPTVQSVSNNRVQISQEWTWNRWSTLLYKYV